MGEGVGGVDLQGRERDESEREREVSEDSTERKRTKGGGMGGLLTSYSSR